MTTKAETTLTIDERLAQLTQESATLDMSRTQAQQEVDACATRMEVLARRISAVQVATTTLAGLAPLAPEQKWFDQLTAWRKTLCDELLALPPRIRSDKELGRQQNLTLSIRTIDFGLGVVNGTGYALETLRLGTLMHEAGYPPTGRTRTATIAA